MMTGCHSTVGNAIRASFVFGLMLALSTPALAESTNGKAASLPINDQMVSYLASRIGTQIGSGECAHVATEALRVGGGEFITSLISKDTPNDGDYVWGTLIAGFQVVNGKLDGNASQNPRPGDVIQYRNVKITTSTSNMSAPHHTSVISAVGSGGAPTEVFEQNVGGRRTLGRSKVDFSKMTAGWIRIYRPIKRISASGRRQFTVVNRTTGNQSQKVTIKGTSSSITLAAQNTSSGFQNYIYTSKTAQIFLVTSANSSVEIIDGAGYEIIGTASKPTIRRLSP